MRPIAALLIVLLAAGAAAEDWLPLPLSGLDVAADGPFDLSRLAAAHAHPGPLRAEGGRFRAADGEAVRLFGANLCWSACFPDPAAAAPLARRLRRMGYTAVRLHNFDGDLCRDADPGLAWNARQMERFDRLVAALVDAGMHLVIDLHAQRALPAGAVAAVPAGLDSRQAKAWIMLDDGAFAAWRAWAAAFLTHRNPFTGRTWLEEPALAAVAPLNEAMVDAVERKKDLAPLRPAVERAWSAWAAAAGIAADDAALRERRMPEFRADLHLAAQRRQVEALRAIGLRAALTDVNFRIEPWIQLVRAGADYVDQHVYHAHPQFPGRPWQEPYRIAQDTIPATGAWFIAKAMPSRLVGRPFMLSEWNACYPNRDRAAAGIAMGAYAALQDWDGIFRFAFANREAIAERPSAIWQFNIAGDPLARLSELSAAFLYLRGDLAPAEACTVLRLRRGDPALDWASADAFRPLAQLGLRRRVATAVGDDPLPPGAEEIAPADLPRLGERAADPAPVRLDAAADTLVVDTPRSFCASLPAGAAADGLGGRIANRGDGRATVAVHSLDGAPIAGSRRLLVLLLTDVRNTGTAFQDAAGTLLTAWGELPLRLRAGRASLALAGPAVQAVDALALDGTVAGRLPGTALDLASAVPGVGATLAFLVTR